MPVDEFLIEELEYLQTGENNHQVTSLIATYRSAYYAYEATQEEEFRKIAHQAEKRLRALRARLLLRKAGLPEAMRKEP